MQRTVSRIIDGDTFETTTNIQGTNFVRLARVNAPEKGTARGTKATAILRGLIGGKIVRIDPKAISYGRIVADVYYGGKNISDEMKRRLR
jgi:endonuclease YncB( thermonuclease family)